MLKGYRLEGNKIATPTPGEDVLIPGKYVEHGNLFIYLSQLFDCRIASLVSTTYTLHRHLFYLNLDAPDRLETVFADVECGFHYDELLVIKQNDGIYVNQTGQCIEVPAAWQVQEILPAPEGFMLRVHFENQFIEVTYSLLGERLAANRVSFLSHSF